jgi:hypothetical protein
MLFTRCSTLSALAQSATYIKGTLTAGGIGAV